MNERTEQQQAFVDEVCGGGRDAVCGIARAGSGKTTTMIAAIEALPANATTTLCAFSKSIADAFTERIGERRNVHARTLHGIGYRAILFAHGKREVDRNHEHDIALDICGDNHRDVVEDVAAIAVLAKDVAPLTATLERLAEIAIEFGHAGEEDEDHGWDVNRRAEAAMEVLAVSRQIGPKISFADMLYLPLVLGLRPKTTDFVFVDEAQDMNAAQHELARRVAAGVGRMVFVGDPRQAIYSWRGASPGSLERWAKQYRARVFSMTTTFRCSRAVVDAAREIVPDLVAAPDAKLGRVRDAHEAELLSASAPGDLVLSRTNAPLVRLCLAMIQRGKRAHISGAQAGHELDTLITRLAKRAKGSVANLVTEALAWSNREIARATKRGATRRAVAVADQAETILMLAERTQDLGILLGWIDGMFRDPPDGADRSVTFMTVHRAKGLEAERVWVLEQSLEDIMAHPKSDPLEEANVRYVAYTRARTELILVRRQ